MTLFTALLSSLNTIWLVGSLNGTKFRLVRSRNTMSAQYPGSSRPIWSPRPKVSAPPTVAMSMTSAVSSQVVYSGETTRETNAAMRMASNMF